MQRQLVPDLGGCHSESPIAPELQPGFGDNQEKLIRGPQGPEGAEGPRSSDR